MLFISGNNKNISLPLLYPLISPPRLDSILSNSGNTACPYNMSIILLPGCISLAVTSKSLALKSNVGMKIGVIVDLSDIVSAKNPACLVSIP